MRKIVFGLIMVLVLAGCPLGSESNPKDVNVSQVNGLRDGTYVRISGEIKEMLIEGFYLFSDNTGSISVEVDRDVWARAQINTITLTLPARFEIVGEVDKDRGEQAIIEVERIKKL